MGTDVDSTVFRKLNELAYRTSYSHRGSYYTLDEIAQFDRKGLWSLRSVWFSKYGTLLATVKALVAACEAGYYVDELEDVVQVDVKAPLLKLVREKRLAREQVFGRYLYLATDVSTRKQQLSARQVHEASPSTLGWVGGVRVLPVELKAAIVLFYSLLDEKQRRLYAGVEARSSRWRPTAMLGISEHGSQRCRELLMRDVELDGVRRKGGGRRAVTPEAAPHEARHRGRPDRECTPTRLLASEASESAEALKLCGAEDRDTQFACIADRHPISSRPGGIQKRRAGLDREPTLVKAMTSYR